MSCVIYILEVDAMKRITSERLSELVNVALKKIIETHPELKDNDSAARLFAICSEVTHCTIAYVLRDLELLEDEPIDRE